MMQLTCPWCGPRDETEFALRRRRRHIARPALAATTRTGADYLFFRDNPKGVHLERWRHAYGCGQWFNIARDTVTHDVLAVYRMGDPPPAAREPAGGRATCSSGRGAASTARGRCRFTFNGRALRRLCRRHARLGAARQRRAARRPQLQIPPAARGLVVRSRGAERARGCRRSGARRTPNVRATLLPIAEGLGARASTAGRASASTSAR